MSAVVKTPGDAAILLNPAVAEERPPASYLFTAAKVYRYQLFGLFIISAVYKFALRSDGKAAAPKFGLAFCTYSVNSHYRESVGYSMSALHGDPCFALSLLFSCGVMGVVADGSGVDKDFCSP